MIWAAFSTCGQSEMAWLKGRRSAKDYVDRLREFVLPFASLTDPDGFDFQQDNASMHRARLTMKWLDDNIDIIDWTAVSLDRNPIEDVWRMLDRT